jgi:hypothetical protein
MMARTVSRKVRTKSPAKRARKATARTTGKKRIRAAYTTADVKTLKSHSRAKTPIKVIAKEMRRTEGSLRQKAMALGIRLGHRR